jgi:MbtH protein
MNNEETDRSLKYRVVINQEGQYSIWPLHRANPLGWTDAGREGLKDECLAYIEQVWTDMRPLSLQKKMNSKLLA